MKMPANPALQPTVFAFGALIARHGANFPRHAARWLGAAELDRWGWLMKHSLLTLLLALLPGLVEACGLYRGVPPMRPVIVELAIPFDPARAEEPQQLRSIAEAQADLLKELPQQTYRTTVLFKYTPQLALWVDAWAYSHLLNSKKAKRVEDDKPLFTSRASPNLALQPTVLAFGIALPSTRCARLGAAELDR